MGNITGKCLCETVSYQITGQLGPIYNCHCSKCRRWHGAAFRTRASFHRDQFRWLTGADNLSSYASSDNVTRYFCRTCGSPLISTYKDHPEVLGMALGGFEGAIIGQPKAHLFTDSKASWHQITDELPQFPDWPGAEAAVREIAD